MGWEPLTGLETTDVLKMTQLQSCNSQKNYLLRSSQHPLVWVLGHNRVESPVCQTGPHSSLPPFSENLFIAKAENSDDSLQQSPVFLHGPSAPVLKGVLVSPTDLAKDNFRVCISGSEKQLPGVTAVLCWSLGVTPERITQVLDLAACLKTAPCLSIIAGMMKNCIDS